MIPSINYKYQDSLKFNPYESQIPESTAKVGMALQEQYNQGRKEIQNTIDTLYSIPSLAGKDTEVKNQLITELNDNLSKVSNKNFADPNIRGQINSYINKYLESGDLVNIAQRAYKKKELLDKYEKLTEKGDTLNPWDMEGLNEINRYENSGTYIKNKSFNGDVYKSPNYDKLLSDTYKNMEQSLIMSGDVPKGWNSDLYNTETKGKFADKITAATIEAIKNDPNAYGSMLRMARYNLGLQGKTSSQVYLNSLNKKREIDARTLIAANSIGDVKTVEEATKSIRDTENKIRALSIEGADNIADDWMVEELIKDKASAFGKAMESKEEVYKVDEYAKMKQNYIYDVEKMKQQAIIDREGFITSDGTVIPPKPTSGNASNFNINSLDDIKNSYKENSTPATNGYYRLKTLPPIFSSDVFEEDVITDVPDMYDAKGNIIYKPSKNKAKPSDVFYNPNKDEYVVQWKNKMGNRTNSRGEKYTEVVLKGKEGVNEYLKGKSPAYAKLVGNNTQNNDSKYNYPVKDIKLSNGKVVKGYELPTINDTTSLKKGTYYIVNNIPYIKD